ncbi:MAG: Wzz/FepE/Etk N-terminal domain-containing protein, partial [Nocardioidaceae bacterium]
MSEAEANASRHLGDYVSLLRRQWLVILVVIVVGVAAGFGALAILPKSYSASSAVLVRATTDPAGSAEATDARVPGEVNMDTESQVVKSLLVAGAVKELLDSPLTPPQLAAAVSVSIPPNTTIMTIQYEASSASEAQQGATAFAKAYLDNRARVAQSHVDTQLKQLDQQAADIDQQIQTLLRKLPTLEAGSTERLTA